MKIGDSIYCKKDFKTNFDFVIFQSGKEYIIEDMWFNDGVDDYKQKFGLFLLKEKIYLPSYWVEIAGEESINNKNVRSVRHFSLVRMGTCNYLYDYFKSIAELRRDKLRKIML